MSNSRTLSDFVGSSGTPTFSSNTTFSANVAVTGAAAMSNTLAVTGNATFSNSIVSTGAVTFANTLAVTGNTTFSNTVTIANTSLFIGDRAIANTPTTNSNGYRLEFDSSYDSGNGSTVANKIRLHQQPNWIGGFGITDSAMNYHSGGSHKFWGSSNGTSYGNSLMVIDAAGRVTMPYQPAFKIAYDNGTLSGGQRIQQSTVPLLAGRDSFDRGSNYNHTTGKFTAPVAGVYFFCISWMRNGNSAGAPTLRFQKNSGGNSMWARYYNAAYTTNYETGVLTSITTLQTNDTVEVVSTDGTVSFYQDDSFFFGYLIG